MTSSRTRINDGPGSSGSREPGNATKISAVKVGNLPNAAARVALADCPSPYEEKNGLVVIETENLTLPTGWQKRTTESNYTGSGYITWVNAENFATPGIGVIETTVKITKAGKYTFQWRSKVGLGTAGNEHNDSWLRFPDASDFYAEKNGLIVYPKGTGKSPVAFGAGGDGWFKIFYNAAGLVWAWNSFANDEDGMPVKVEFNAPGVYKLQISARASYHLIDRIVLFHSTITQSAAQLLTNAETTSECATPGNSAPVVTAQIPDQTATVGANWSYTVPANTFTDINDDAMTYSASLNNNAALPSWLSFNGATRTFSGIAPSNTAPITVKVLASDGKGGSASDDFVLSFTNSTTNTIPVLTAIGSQTATINKPLTFTAQATDADAGQSVTYSISGPSGASINPTTGEFSWTPTALGTYNIAIKAADNGSPVLTAQEIVTVSVVPPVSQQSVVSFSLMNATSDQEIKVMANGDRLNLATLPSRNLNIRVNTNPSPVGSVRMVLTGAQGRTQVDNGLPYALFGDTNGDFKNWTPAVGTYTLTATPYVGTAATDTAGRPLTISFTVIDQAPRPPVVANAIPEQHATANLAFTFAFDANAFTDPDGDVLTYSASLSDNTALPEWLSFTSDTRTFNGTPPAGGPESITVKVTANDGQNGTVSSNFVITIAPPIVAGGWQNIIPNTGKPTARFENGYVQVGDKFYLIGGRGIKPVQVYNPITKVWTNAAQTPVDMHHFQAVTLDGLVYVVGALSGSYPQEPTVNQVHIYDPKANKWYLGPDIPVDRRRGTAGVVVYNKKIYIVGGNTKGHNNGYVAWFDEYDPATGIWRTLADAPHARDHFQAVVYENKLYAAAGRRTSANTNQTFTLTVPEVDVYDFTTGQWSTLPNPIPTQRAGTTSVVLDGELVVIGGESNQPAAHGETEALNFGTGIWKKLANMQKGRHATQAIVNNGGIYVAAGSGAQGSNAISEQEVYFKGEPTTPTVTQVTPGSISDDAGSSKVLSAIPVNATRTSIIKLSNTGGNQAIVVTSASFPQGSEFKVNYPVPFVIPAGETVNLPISFSPLSEGFKNATLAIRSSDVDGDINISVLCEATAANKPPVLAEISSKTATLGQALTFTVQATDPDTDQSLTYSVAGAASASIDANTGAFSWTPTTTGTVSLTVTATDNGLPALSDQKVFTVTVPQAVVSFSLMNASNEQEIKEMSNGETINLATLPSRNLNIRINTNVGAVGSVRMVLSGKQSRTQTDNGLPYALFGDVNGNFNNWTPATGSYTLTATPYTASGAAGTAGTPLTLSFTVIDQAPSNTAPVARAGADQTITLPTNSVTLDGSTSSDANGSITAYSWTQQSGPALATLSNNSAATLTASNLVAGTYVFRLTVTDNQNTTASDEVIVTVSQAAAAQQVVSVSLMNADNEQEILTLTDGQVLNLATLVTRSLNIRANTNPSPVGSVRMVLSGKQSRTQTETGFPYALFGDNNGNYNGWTPAVGNYTLTVTPYTGAGATGAAGTPLTVSFSVVDQAAAGRLSVFGNPETAGMSIKTYPNPFTRSFNLQIKGRQEGKLPVVVYDSYGRVVLQLEDVASDQQINLGSEFVPGLYIIQVGKGNQAKRFKLVKGE
ncbi:putative Ig domain-containing protein [Larkinella insperata]|uniref:putative Ig domain-containing protein n=1 Tax=Larkinella insperata TaxID=332158 RepID=UPI0022494314|nr:putative Ig domain-containing protein [Larkinella insperata]